MKILELPFIYVTNFKEVQDAEKQGIEVDEIYEVKKSTLFIPDNRRFLVGYQLLNDKVVSTIDFGDICYDIDVPYDALVELLRMEFKI